MKLSNKVAVITGAASGMGKQTAQLFASEGAKVIVADLNKEAGQEVVDSLKQKNEQAEFNYLDVTDEKSWDTLVKAHPIIDILVNNAGIDTHSTIENETLDDWNKTIAVNLTGPMLGIRAVMPIMKKEHGGSIINIGSAAGETGHPFTAYSTTKWGVRGLTRSAAYLLGDDGIRVNAIHPGLVHTPLVASMYDKFAEAVPGKRGAEPIEIAKVSLFLASDDSSYINGQDIMVDNGMVNLGTYKGIMKHVNG